MEAGTSCSTTSASTFASTSTTACLGHPGSAAAACASTPSGTDLPLPVPHATAGAHSSSASSCRHTSAGLYSTLSAGWCSACLVPPVFVKRQTVLTSTSAKVSRMSRWDESGEQPHLCHPLANSTRCCWTGAIVGYS